MTDHLRELAKAAERLTKAHAARDAAILAAHADGLKPTAIGNAVGLSRVQVHRIVTAASENDESAPSQPGG